MALRGQLFMDPTLAARMKERGHKFRVVDKDVKGANDQPPADLVPYLKRASGKSFPQFFLVSPDGTLLHEGDLPKSPADLIAVMQKVGG